MLQASHILFWINSEIADGISASLNSENTFEANIYLQMDEKKHQTAHHLHVGQMPYSPAMQQASAHSY